MLIYHHLYQPAFEPFGLNFFQPLFLIWLLTSIVVVMTSRGTGLATELAILLLWLFAVPQMWAAVNEGGEQASAHMLFGPVIIVGGVVMLCRDWVLGVRGVWPLLFKSEPP